MTIPRFSLSHDTLPPADNAKHLKPQHRNVHAELAHHRGQAFHDALDGELSGVIRVAERQKHETVAVLEVDPDVARCHAKRHHVEHAGFRNTGRAVAASRSASAQHREQRFGRRCRTPRQ